MTATDEIGQKQDRHSNGDITPDEHEAGKAELLGHCHRPIGENDDETVSASAGNGGEGGKPILFGSPASSMPKDENDTEPQGDASTVDESESAPASKRKKGGLVVAIAAGAVALVAVVFGVLVYTGAFLPPATRGIGELPNIPAVMARIDRWSDQEYVSQLKLSDVGSMKASKEYGQLSDVSTYGASGVYCLSTLAGNDGSFEVSFLDLPCSGPQVLMRVTRSWLSLQTYESAYRLGSMDVFDCNSKGYEECENMLSRLYLSIPTVGFDKKDALSLLENMGVDTSKTSEAIESTGKRGLDAALSDYLSNQETTEFGTEYQYIIKTADTAGKDIYVSVWASNSVNLTNVPDILGLDYIGFGGGSTVHVFVTRTKPEPFTFPGYEVVTKPA